MTTKNRPILTLLNIWQRWI